jgi:hypothetical protein
MSDRQLQLAAKRHALIAESTAQREQLKSLAGDVKERLAGLDHGIEVVRTIAKKPTVIAGAIAMVSFIGPRRLFSAVTRSAMFISAGRRLVGLWRGSRSPKSPAVRGQLQADSGPPEQAVLR